MFAWLFLCVFVLSVREYLRERAAESRHNELLAYLMFVVGCVLFVGGVLETLFVCDSVMWMLFVPVGWSVVPGSVLGLALTLSGVVLGVFGLVAGVFFARDRSWYIRELGSVGVSERGAVEGRRRGKAKSGSARA